MAHGAESGVGRKKSKPLAKPTKCASTHPPTAHHPDHSREQHRLSRIIGQLEGIRRMLDERRYCVDILQQTRAAKSAIRGFESAILATHMRHCFTKAVGSGDFKASEAVVREFIDLFDQG